MLNYTVLRFLFQVSLYVHVPFCSKFNRLFYTAYFSNVTFLYNATFHYSIHATLCFLTFVKAVSSVK